MVILSFVVLFFVNWIGGTLNGIKYLGYSDIDKISMANVPSGSKRDMHSSLWPFKHNFLLGE